MATGDVISVYSKQIGAVDIVNVYNWLLLAAAVNVCESKQIQTNGNICTYMIAIHIHILSYVNN